MVADLHFLVTDKATKNAKERPSLRSTTRQTEGQLVTAKFSLRAQHKHTSVANGRSNEMKFTATKTK